mmetsp:Transcript_26925/g.77247  ORF Transcript_26925/g.77247 Transcript_26925/m.77247 type:complete len:264 (+) Transcript_26925:868-1659(+)
MCRQGCAWGLPGLLLHLLLWHLLSRLSHKHFQHRLLLLLLARPLKLADLAILLPVLSRSLWRQGFLLNTALAAGTAADAVGNDSAAPICGRCRGGGTGRDRPSAGSLKRLRSSLLIPICLVQASNSLASLTLGLLSKELRHTISHCRVFQGVAPVTEPFTQPGRHAYRLLRQLHNSCLHRLLLPRSRGCRAPLGALLRLPLRHGRRRRHGRAGLLFEGRLLKLCELQLRSHTGRLHQPLDGYVTDGATEKKSHHGRQLIGQLH